MTHFFLCIAFAVGGAAISGILVDLKWRQAVKKLIDRITSLEGGLSVKQLEINNLNSKLIAANARINMLDVSLCAKDKELNYASKKVTSAPVVATEKPTTKKRGPYKKKRYGRPASNNNSAKKGE
jgi:hypothetical protein